MELVLPPGARCVECAAGPVGGEPDLCSMACRRSVLHRRKKLVEDVRELLADAPSARIASSGSTWALVEVTHAEVAFFHRVTALRAVPEPFQRVEALSPQLWLTCLLVGDGFTNTEVGEMLAISGHTVRNYLSAIFAQLHLRNRTELGALVGAIRTRVELDPAVFDDRPVVAPVDG